MRLQLERTVREGKEPGGLHVNHAILILEWPFDQQKFAARDQQAVAVVEIRCDDDISDAGFVFHGKEDEAFGCARALASNDAASGARALYANFEDKEDLFLAVIREEQAWRANMFPSILTD